MISQQDLAAILLLSLHAKYSVILLYEYILFSFWCEITYLINLVSL